MQKGSKIKHRMANSIDPDETARYKPSHQDLHCLHRDLLWSKGIKGVRGQYALDTSRLYAITAQGDNICEFLSAFMRTNSLFKGTEYTW